MLSRKRVQVDRKKIFFFLKFVFSISFRRPPVHNGGPFMI